MVLEAAGERVLLKPAEVAERYLNCSRAQVYTLIARGEVPGVVHVGQSIRIHRETLEAWLRDQAGGRPSAA
jgi:excisionase family DNA binding protein